MNQNDQDSGPRVEGSVNVVFAGNTNHEVSNSITLQGHFASWFESAYGDIDESYTRIAIETRA